MGKMQGFLWKKMVEKVLFLTKNTLQ